jgi:signal transduction histidine kinase
MAPGPLPIDADWNRLAQVIGNLLQNAAKFTGRSGRVTVSIAREPASAFARIRLGLALAKGLLELHGGVITAHQPPEPARSARRSCSATSASPGWTAWVGK